MSATGNWASTLLRWLFLLEHFPKTMQLFDNDNFSRGWPWLRSARTGDCTRGLEPGGREGDRATMSQNSTSLSMSNNFSSSSKVSLILHIFYALVLTDLLRFACCQNLFCQEACQQGKGLERVHSAEEDSAACQEGEEHSGFRGNEWKYC